MLEKFERKGLLLLLKKKHQGKKQVYQSVLYPNTIGNATNI